MTKPFARTWHCSPAFREHPTDNRLTVFRQHGRFDVTAVSLAEPVTSTGVSIRSAIRTRDVASLFAGRQPTPFGRT